MDICYFGTYEEAYPRNQIMLKALKHLGHNVNECHVSLWKNKIDKSGELTGIRRILYFSYDLIVVYLKLFFKYLSVKPCDVVFVGYLGHLDVLVLQFFNFIMFRKRKLVFDTFISLYDSMVTDRQMIHDHSIMANVAFWIDKLACKYSDLVILDTNAHIAFFNETFSVPYGKMTRIFAGADDDYFYPRSGELSDRICMILFVGKYIPLHGIEHIIGAAELLKTNSDISFTLIGKGQIYSAIRNLAYDKHLNNIVFIEWVEYDRLPDYIAAANICLGVFAGSKKTSRVIPNKVFQAMAMAKPTITGRTVASLEILRDGENALLCNVSDPASLAESIIKLKNDKQLQLRLSYNARKTFANTAGRDALKISLSHILQKL